MQVFCVAAKEAKLHVRVKVIESVFNSSVRRMLIFVRQLIVGMRHELRRMRKIGVMDERRLHKTPHDDACVPKAS